MKKKKKKKKIFHKTLIEIICSNDQLKDKKSYKELSEYYQIKNYLRDIDFCLGKVIIDIIKVRVWHDYRRFIKS